MSAAPALASARIRRVDMPTGALIAITIAARELRGALVIGIGPAARGVGFVAQRPPGRADSPFLLRARSCLEGGKITRFAWPNAAFVRIEIERGADRFALELTLRGAHGNACLLDAAGAVLASLHPIGEGPAEGAAHVHAGAPDLDWPALRAEGARLLEAIGHDAFAQQRAALARALRDASRKERKKLAAIEGDLARANDVEQLRRNASLVLTHLHALARDAREATLLDHASDPPAEVTLQFDPALGPKQQAEIWFRRARKLERGAAIARERAQAASARAAALEALATHVQAANDPADLAALGAQAQALGIGPAPSAPGPAGKRGQPGARVPYREFSGSGGRAILVGRGASDNDRLTLDHARPQDLWLHARDEAGAHVVVPLERDEACPPDLLRDAAMLAAHFSQARGHARVDVVYTPRRYVRKPSKAAAGSVQLMRERVFRLQLEPARLQQLLAAERSRS
jgi:predicted ribosome quality control (RQC) complex YloA/Tae2 family protein